ncbi:hypothetical protein Q5752_006576 [Cryptotrichosporon argae]
MTRADTDFPLPPGAAPPVAEPFVLAPPLGRSASPQPSLSRSASTAGSDNEAARLTAPLTPPHSNAEPETPVLSTGKQAPSAPPRGMSLSRSMQNLKAKVGSKERAPKERKTRTRASTVGKDAPVTVAQTVPPVPPVPVVPATRAAPTPATKPEVVSTKPVPASQVAQKTSKAEKSGGLGGFLRKLAGSSKPAPLIPASAKPIAGPASSKQMSVSKRPEHKAKEAPPAPSLAPSMSSHASASPASASRVSTARGIVPDITSVLPPMTRGPAQTARPVTILRPVPSMPEIGKVGIAHSPSSASLRAGYRAGSPSGSASGSVTPFPSRSPSFLARQPPDAFGLVSGNNPADKRQSTMSRRVPPPRAIVDPCQIPLPPSPLKGTPALPPVPTPEAVTIAVFGPDAEKADDESATGDGDDDVDPDESADDSTLGSVDNDVPPLDFSPKPLPVAEMPAVAEPVAQVHVGHAGVKRSKPSAAAMLSLEGFDFDDDDGDDDESAEADTSAEGADIIRPLALAPLKIPVIHPYVRPAEKSPAAASGRSAATATTASTASDDDLVTPSTPDRRFAGSSPPRKAPVGTGVLLEKRQSKWRKSLAPFEGAFGRKPPPPPSVAHPVESYVSRQKRLQMNRTSCAPTLHSQASVVAELREIKDREEQEALETFFLS